MKVKEIFTIVFKMFRKNYFYYLFHHISTAVHCYIVCIFYFTHTVRIIYFSCVVKVFKKYNFTPVIQIPG